MGHLIYQSLKFPDSLLGLLHNHTPSKRVMINPPKKDNWAEAISQTWHQYREATKEPIQISRYHQEEIKGPMFVRHPLHKIQFHGEIVKRLWYKISTHLTFPYMFVIPMAEVSTPTNFPKLITNQPQKPQITTQLPKFKTKMMTSKHKNTSSHKSSVA